MKKYLERFEGKRVLVVGDICLDRSRVGDIIRGSSREANIPTIRYVHGKKGHKEEYAPGGGGNLAVNLTSLGAQVSVLGVIGRDYHSEILLRELNIGGIDTQFLLRDLNRVTMTFERSYKAKGSTRPVGRWDGENSKPIYPRSESRIANHILEAPQNYDAVVAIDHCEVDESTAVITPMVLETLASLQGKTPTFGSSRNRIGKFQDGFYCLVPNDNEAARAIETSSITNPQEKVPYEDLEEITRDFFGKTRPENLVVTAGENGAVLLNPQGYSPIPTKPLRRKIDICGCGDTFLATLVLANLSGAKFPEAIKIANAAAGTTVLKLRTTGAPTLGELEEALEQ